MATPDSSLIAIDMALVPPDWVQDRARHVNQGLAGGGLQFDATHVPHITLAQCFTWRASLPMLVERLDIALRGASSLPISAIALVDQDSTISFLLDRTPELQKLHETLMDALKEWEEEGGTASAFYSEGKPPREKDIAWVENFRTGASYRNFIPHITLGFGRTEGRAEPFDFLVTRLGLFHLGCYCACRLLLKEWRLC
jgi:2'-5' RNA ligase